MDESPQLSVVIPAYNEARRIERSLAETQRYLATRSAPSEIVVVDDGSKDHTAEVVEAYGATHAHVRLVRLSANRGKGAAIRAGVAVTRGVRVLVMDADLATPIGELARLEPALEEGAEVVTASRAVGTSDVRVSQSSLRVLLGRLGNLWIRGWAVPGIFDTQCGFKLFDGDVARDLYSRCHEDRFGIDIEVLHLALRLRHPIAEVGVRWEHQSGSKVRPRDYLDVLVRVPRIVWAARSVTR